MTREQAERELLDHLGDAMKALGKDDRATGANPTLGPPLGHALLGVGLPSINPLDPPDDEFLPLDPSRSARFFALAKLALAKRLLAASVAKIRQRVGRDSEAHWQQLREGLEALVGTLEAELSGTLGGGFAAGPMREGHAPPRAADRRY